MSAADKALLHRWLPLTAVTLVAVATVVIVYHLTSARRADQQLTAQRTALSEIIPAGMHNNDLLSSAFELAPTDSDYQQQALLALTTPRTAYRATLNDMPVGLVLPVETSAGYGGAIVLQVGITAEGQLTGVRAVQHSESAGLGDSIDIAISPWMHSFDNRSLANTPDVLWYVKKDRGDFDQFVGATITPRAVVAAVHNALLFFDSNRERLLGLQAESPAQ